MKEKSARERFNEAVEEAAEKKRVELGGKVLEAANALPGDIEVRILDIKDDHMNKYSDPYYLFYHTKIKASHDFVRELKEYKAFLLSARKADVRVFAVEGSFGLSLTVKLDEPFSKSPDAGLVAGMPEEPSSSPPSGFSPV